MFLEYYGLREQPFGVTPDPRFLYFGATHREALASLFYGIESGCGFLALIAPPGMGKTTLLFHLLEKLRNSAQTVFLFQTQCGSREMFRHLLNDLGIDSGEKDLAAMHESLNSVLLANARKGRRVVLVIDEAQNLKESVLETVRLLSDFETPQSKLLQIVLSGQPQLADKLSHPSLTQLRQRISAITRLNPFTRIETMVYIEYRLCRAGYSGPPLFSYAAADLVAAHSKGTPRIINNLCFNALTLGFAKRQKQIDAATMCEVIADLDLEGLNTHHSGISGLSDDSLSSFDGIAPSNDLTYQDFHDAVRAAWGNGAPIKPEEKPAEDLSKWMGSNGTPRPVEALIRMAVSPEETAGSPFDLDRSEAAGNTNGASSSPNCSASAIALADEVSPHTQELPAGLSVPKSQAAQLETKGTAAVHSQPQPSIPIASHQAGLQLKQDRGLSIGSVFQALRDFFKKGTTSSEVKGRAISGGMIVALAFGLSASGMLFGWRHYVFAQALLQAAPAAPPAVEILQPSGLQEAQSSPEQSNKMSATTGKSPDKSVLITVAHGQTLGEVSLHYLGQFSPKVTREIQKANPQIKDPDLIFEGAQIRLPSPPAQTDGSTTTTGELPDRAEEQQ